MILNDVFCCVGSLPIWDYARIYPENDLRDNYAYHISDRCWQTFLRNNKIKTIYT